jgi:ankyrin repeat protein
VDRYALGSARSIELVDLLRMHADNLTLSSCGILHRACSGGRQSPDYLAQLLERDFDINSRNEFGDTTLLWSCGSTHAKPEIIEVLIRNGSDINARSTTAYHAEVTIGDTPCTSTIVHYYPGFRAEFFASAQSFMEECTKSG